MHPLLIQCAFVPRVALPVPQPIAVGWLCMHAVHAVLPLVPVAIVSVLGLGGVCWLGGYATAMWDILSCCQ